jgi:hypothetical protein
MPHLARKKGVVTINVLPEEAEERWVLIFEPYCTLYCFFKTALQLS